MSFKKSKIIPVLAAAVFLIIPFFAFAASDAAYFPICECCQKDTPCTLYDFFVVVDKIMDAALYLSFFLAVIMIIKGGVTILLGADKPGEVTKGRETVTWAIYGMVIAFGAWLIVNTVLKVFTVGNKDIGSYLNF